MKRTLINILFLTGLACLPFTMLQADPINSSPGSETLHDQMTQMRDQEHSGWDESYNRENGANEANHEHAGNGEQGSCPAGGCGAGGCNAQNGNGSSGCCHHYRCFVQPDINVPKCCHRGPGYVTQSPPD